MELCGSEEGDMWIGYRQQFASDEDGLYEMSYIGRDYHYCYLRPYSVRPGNTDFYTACERCFGGPSQQVLESEKLYKVGGDRVEPAVRSIHQIQCPTPSFSMGINVCEHCHSQFACYFPQDGFGDSVFKTESERQELLKNYCCGSCRAWTCNGCTIVQMCDGCDSDYCDRCGIQACEVCEPYRRTSYQGEVPEYKQVHCPACRHDIHSLDGKADDEDEAGGEQEA